VIEQSTSLGNGTDGQLACFRQCFDRYRNDTDWFAALVRLQAHPLRARHPTCICVVDSSQIYEVVASSVPGAASY